MNERETLRERWARRSLTIPGVFLATLLAWLLLPVLLVLAIAADAALDRRWRHTRFLAFAMVYLNAECVGLMVAGALALLGAILGPERTAHAHHRLEAAWAGVLLRTGMKILGMRFSHDLEAPPTDRPLLLFVRHASLIDSLIPATFLSAGFGTRLRYVMKRELLYDPCLDVVGQRIENVFVRRGSGAAESEVEAIRALANGLGGNEGIVVFPEGTRFTPKARTRALDRLEAAGDAERFAWAQGLRHLLPPRSRGPLALLDAASGADAMFLAHAGFEGGATVTDILGGALIGRSVELTAWRVPADEIPATDPERLAWLDAQWARMDRWLDERSESAPRTAVRQ